MSGLARGVGEGAERVAERDAGRAVLLVSLELEEVLSLADRILVIFEGRIVDELPKTRSGKIMRRLLRSIAKGEAITQDTSTLENPAILEQLTQAN